MDLNATKFLNAVRLGLVPADDVETAYLQLDELVSADTTKPEAMSAFVVEAIWFRREIEKVRAAIQAGEATHEHGCKGRPRAPGEMELVSKLAEAGCARTLIATALGIDTDRVAHLLRTAARQAATSN